MLQNMDVYYIQSYLEKALCFPFESRLTCSRRSHVEFPSMMLSGPPFSSRILLLFV